MGKKFTFIILFFLAFLSTCPAAWGQSDPVHTQVVNCIRSANVGCLANYMGDRTEITISNERRSYAPGQARYVLQQFFDHNRPTYVNITKHGNTGSTYIITAEYKSTKNYEVNILFRKDTEQNTKIDKIVFTAR